MPTSTIYYLPGRGGLLAKGLGAELSRRGLTVIGRETVGSFRDLAFQEQIDAVADDLKNQFWFSDALVIAVSFGAYLFLHAQAQLPPYPGKVLLLSPIVGQFSDESTSTGYIPPRAEKLTVLAENGQYSAPLNCEIDVGTDDWQSHPENVKRFGGWVQAPVTVVSNAGHRLDPEYVAGVLDRWSVDEI